MGKLLIAALLAVLAYKAYGWWRQWQARQDLPAPPDQSPLEAGEDLRRCGGCDRYVVPATIAACVREDCPMKGR
jgi:uncharacterized membrane protein YebE (DUF533 family)